MVLGHENVGQQNGIYLDQSLRAMTLLVESGQMPRPYSGSSISVGRSIPVLRKELPALMSICSTARNLARCFCRSG